VRCRMLVRAWWAEPSSRRRQLLACAWQRWKRFTMCTLTDLFIVTSSRRTSSSVVRLRVHRRFTSPASITLMIWCAAMQPLEFRRWKRLRNSRWCARCSSHASIIASFRLRISKPTLNPGSTSATIFSVRWLYRGSSRRSWVSASIWARKRLFFSGAYDIQFDSLGIPRLLHVMRRHFVHIRSLAPIDYPFLGHILMQIAKELGVNWKAPFEWQKSSANEPAREDNSGEGNVKELSEDTSTE